MDNLDIVFAPAAKREIKKLDRRDQVVIIAAVEALSLAPRPRGVEKIQGHPKFYRIAAGKSHRIIYHILQERLIVILVIRDRKDAYRSLNDLDGKLAAALRSIEHEAISQIRATG